MLVRALQIGSKTSHINRPWAKEGLCPHDHTWLLSQGKERMYSRRTYKVDTLVGWGCWNPWVLMSALLWVLTWALLAVALGEGVPADASLPGFATLKKHPVFSQPWGKHLRDFKILRILAHAKLRPFVICILIYLLKSHLCPQHADIQPGSSACYGSYPGCDRSVG